MVPQLEHRGATHGPWAGRAAGELAPRPAAHLRRSSLHAAQGELDDDIVLTRRRQRDGSFDSSSFSSACIR